ncbi:MAG: flagellar biosynthesis protein FlhB [Gammaproteobacteria bacterium]|nr:flagellar biosynthesis protein FlhB [Gammaproteobacteria bacterium]
MMAEAGRETGARVVGLAYDPGHGLPRVVLKGSGELAQEVIAEGRKLKHNLPVVQDEKLLNALFRLPTEAEIGPELFEMVAVLLAHVYAVDRKMNEGTI